MSPLNERRLLRSINQMKRGQYARIYVPKRIAGRVVMVQVKPYMRVLRRAATLKESS